MRKPRINKNPTPTDLQQLIHARNLLTNVISRATGSASSVHVDGQGGLPAPTGTHIVQFNAGDLTQSAWNNKRLSYPIANATVYGDGNDLPSDQADYDGDTNKKTTTRQPRADRGGNSGLQLSVGHAGISGNSSSNGGDGSKGQLWRFNSGHEIPAMNSNGEFECTRFTGMHDLHSMITFVEQFGNEQGGFANTTSWLPNKRYEKIAKIRFPNDPADYGDAGIVIDQLRGDGYSGPQIGLYNLPQGNVPTLYIRQFDPTGSPNQWKFSPALPVTFYAGMELEFRWEIVLSEAGGSDPDPVTKLWIDKVLVYDDNEANFAGTSAIQNTIGNYDYTGNSSNNTIVINSYNLWYQDV